jgi:hypothetical protein
MQEPGTWKKANTIKPSNHSAVCASTKFKARDMYYAYKLLEVEAAERAGRNPWKEFFGVRRNRRAAQSAFFVMFMQQFCGVNVSDAATLSRLNF